jgi:hypothetical protein
MRCVFLLLLLAAIGWATLSQQQHLTNSDSYFFGYDVATSGDGTTLVSGAPYGWSQIGKVDVYRKTSGVWYYIESLTSQNISGDLAMSGEGVAISDDANTLAYGEPGENTEEGVVSVKTKNGGGTYDDLADLSPSNAVGPARFGSRVRFCNGASTLVVGAPGDNSEIGAVWVFVLQSGSYTQVAKLVGTGHSGTPRQGFAFDVTSDCSTIAVGGPGDNNNVGAVWVFVSSGTNTWSQQGSKLVGSNPSRSPKIGTSLSLSSSGDRLAIGGPWNNFTGATWIFDRASGSWSETAYIRFSTSYTYSAQGLGLALASNGNTLYISAPNEGPGVGIIKTYTYSGGVWSSANSWNPTGYGDTPRVGVRITLSSDGSTLVAGAYQENYNMGGIYVLST